jgi:hypothetical protein
MKLEDRADGDKVNVAKPDATVCDTMRHFLAFD